MLNIEKANNIKLLSENMDLRAKNKELNRKTTNNAPRSRRAASEDEKRYIYLLNRKF